MRVGRRGFRVVRPPHEEDEPARRPASSGKRTGDLVAGDHALRPPHMESEPAGRRAPARNRLSGPAAGDQDLRFPLRMRKLPGGSRRLEPGRALARWGPCPPSSARWPRPSWSTGRSDKAVSRGSIPRWPTPGAVAELVSSARLIIG